MKENHKIESLEALSKSVSRERIRRFESSARLYAYSFDRANESKLSDESSTGIYKESRILDAPPPNNQDLRRSNSPSRRIERSWHPGPPLNSLSRKTRLNLCAWRRNCAWAIPTQQHEVHHRLRCPASEPSGLTRSPKSIRSLRHLSRR